MVSKKCMDTVREDSHCGTPEEGKAKEEADQEEENPKNGFSVIFTAIELKFSVLITVFPQHTL